MAAADAYNFDEAVNRTRHESALGLPPFDKFFLILFGPILQYISVKGGNHMFHYE